MSDFLDRIFKHILVDEKTNCWNYTRYKRSGYAFLPYKGKNMSGSRAVLIEITGLHLGNPLMFACHKCNNRACINPDHLYWGTRSDNTKDSIKAGVHNWIGKDISGENHPSAKLNKSMILEILKLRKEGIPVRKIAVLYNVSESAIFNLNNKNRWKSVER